MWHSIDAQGITNTVVLPTAGAIGVSFPPEVSVTAYVNDILSPIHHVHANAGDRVYFKIEGNPLPESISITYDGQIHSLPVQKTDSENPISQAAVATEVAKLSKKQRKLLKRNKLKEIKMSNALDGLNLFTSPSMTGAGGMAGAGAGLGAGLVGGLLGTALFGRNGLNGLNGVDGGACATPSQVTSTVNDAAMMTQLADIKAAVPLSEAQVQLALAGQSASITNQIHQASDSITAQNTAQSLAQAAGFSNVNNAIFSSTNELVGVANTNNLAQINAINAAAIESLKNTYALNTSISNEGVATRAAVESSKDEILAAMNARAQLEDTRLITNLSNEITELRGDRRLAEATGNITITNTNTANAIQSQNQAQQQFQILAQLAAQVQNLANDVQVVRQGQTIFNSGNMSASGTQTAANTRVS